MLSAALARRPFEAGAASATCEASRTATTTAELRLRKLFLLRREAFTIVNQNKAEGHSVQRGAEKDCKRETING